MAVKTLSNTTSGMLWTDRRDFYISPNEVRELWTDVAPFTTVVSNRGMVKVQDPDFKMFEHRSGFIKQAFVLNDATPPAWSGTGNSNDTLDAAMAIDGILGLASAADDSYVGLILECWDTTEATYKGVSLVTAAATTVTIKSLGNPRSATNVHAALADDDIFYVIGNAQGEGTEAPEAFSDDLDVVYNSTQIFKTPIEITGTLYEAALRGYSSELERLRIEKNKEHRMQKERAFLFGVRRGGTGSDDLAGDNATNLDSHDGHLSDANSKLVRTTMGIIPAIYRYGVTSGDQQNIFSVASSSYDYSAFVDDMEKVFQYLPEDGTKVAFCGAGALSYWSKVDGTTGFVGKSGFSVQLNTMQRSSLGFDFREIITPHGVLQLVYAPALRGPYSNYMVIVDPAELKYVQYRPSKFMANVKTDNAYDGVKDLYFSDEGLGVTLIEKHSVWVVS